MTAKGAGAGGGGGSAETAPRKQRAPSAAVNLPPGWGSTVRASRAVIERRNAAKQKRQEQAEWEEWRAGKARSLGVDKRVSEFFSVTSSTHGVLDVRVCGGETGWRAARCGLQWGWESKLSGRRGLILRNVTRHARTAGLARFAGRNLDTVNGIQTRSLAVFDSVYHKAKFLHFNFCPGKCAAVDGSGRRR